MTGFRTSASRSHCGFTLLEILIATAVGAIVLLVINGTFFSALGLSNTTREHLAADLQLQRALGIVQRDLEGLMLPNGTLAGQLQTSTTSSLTQGNYGDQIGPDLYTNTGTIDGWNPFSEVQMVDYFLAPATDGSDSKTLVRVVTRNLLTAQTATPDVQTLVPGITEAGIEFYDGTDWTDTWDSTVTSTLPIAIRFHLVLAGTNHNLPKSAPFELVVPVLVSNTTSQTQTTSGGAGT